MPLIEPENKNKSKKISICLNHESFTELSQYCQFIDSSCDHVIGSLIQSVFARDREYQAWKADASNRTGIQFADHVRAETRGRKKLSKSERIKAMRQTETA